MTFSSKFGLWSNLAEKNIHSMCKSWVPNSKKNGMLECFFGKPVSFNFLIAHSILEFWTEQTRCPTLTFSSVGSHGIDLVAWPDPDEHQDATCENYFPGIKQVAPISSCDIRHLRDGNWWRSKRWGITLKLTSSTSHLFFGPCIWFWMIITNVPQARNSRHSQE